MMKKIILTVVLLVSAILVFYVVSKNRLIGTAPDSYFEYIDWVVTNKKPELCAEINFEAEENGYVIPPSDLRFFCYADYAISADDLEYCEGLDNTADLEVGRISQRHKCLDGIAEKRKDASICEKLSFTATDKYSADELRTMFVRDCSDNVKSKLTPSE